MNRCVECGVPVGPRSRLCLRHAAANARRSMALLRESNAAASEQLMRSWFGLGTEDVAKELGLPISVVNTHLAETLAAKSRATASHGSDDDLQTTVLDLGVRLAAEITSLSGQRYSVDYLRISGETVIPLGVLATEPRPKFPLSEHPFLMEMVATGQPVAGELRNRRLGERARSLAARLGIVAGGGVPVKVKGSVHGILSLSTAGVQPSHALLQHIGVVARIIEIALAHHH